MVVLWLFHIFQKHIELVEKQVAGNSLNPTTILVTEFRKAWMRNDQAKILTISKMTKTENVICNFECPMRKVQKVVKAKQMME